MSKFYAKFKETNYEIMVFPTEEARDKWVNFQDDFDLALNDTAETAIFQREALSRQKASYLIRTYGLVETSDTDLMGRQLTLYMKPINDANPPIKKSKKYPDVSLEPTIGLSERKMIAEATIKNSIHIGEKQLALIPVPLLYIQVYQRNREMKHAAKIAENWNPAECNVLLVSYDEEKYQFNVMDGQHRAIAAKMRGVDFLVCEIFNNMSLSTEAKKFVRENTNKRKLSPYAIYKANQY